MPKDFPLYNHAELISLLVEPGLDEKQAAFQVQRFARLGLLHSTARASKGTTSARFYDEAAVAVAKNLSELTFMQIADRELMAMAVVNDPSQHIGNPAIEPAALSMNAWAAPDESKDWTPDQWTFFQKTLPAKTPMHYGLILWRAGKWPVFEFRFLRHDQTGERRAVGAVYDPQVNTPNFPDSVTTGFSPVGSIIINQVPLYARLFSDRAKAN